MERFTKDAHEAVTRAEEEARRRADGRIGTEHLLLGVLASEALQGLGLRSDALRRELDRLSSEALASVGIDPRLAKMEAADTRSTTSRGRHLPFTEAAKNTLKRALHEAIDLKHRNIGPEHIALALSDLPGTDRAIRALHGLELSPAQMRSALSDILRRAS